MKKHGQIGFSAATTIIVILSIVIIGAGFVLVNNMLKSTELPAFQKSMPQFFKISSFPEKGQIGTVFRINLELTNKTGVYHIDAKITNAGKIISTIALYDDGSHGDSSAGDGIYANTWDSSGNSEGVYDLNIIINPSDKQIEYEKVASLNIFKEKCESLIYNGDPAEKVDVAIVPYGYSNLDDFRQDALNWITKGLLNYEPFKSEKDKFNFYIVNQKSDFLCNRDNATRTLMYCDDIAVERTASQCPSDEIVVILDDKEFCGTASSYAKACNGWNLRQVATHEFGHSFAGLGDEYSYGSAYPQYKIIAEDYPNCDVDGCKKWQNINNIGCYGGCGSDELFRATKENCIMKKYVDTFCPVCENHIEYILENYEKGEIQNLAAMPAEKIYLVDLKYEKGNLSFKDVYATSGTAPDRKIKEKADYTAKLMSFDNKVIYSFDFALPNILHLPPPQNENESSIGSVILDKLEWTIPAKQSDKASKLDIYDSQKKLLSIDVGYFSNSCGDGKCEKHESALECPSDCKENIKDDLCNYEKNGICDPDCKNVDPDCKKENWILAGLIAVSVILIIAIVMIGRRK